MAPSYAAEIVQKYPDIATAKCSLDLSGAYLSGANLSSSDLSGVNIGEANLSEANLSGLDLSEAYLSGAYLSGANVVFTRFEAARGIVEESERDLIQRGAIFEDASDDRSEVPTGR